MSGWLDWHFHSEVTVSVCSIQVSFGLPVMQLAIHERKKLLVIAIVEVCSEKLKWFPSETSVCIS